MTPEAYPDDIEIKKTNFKTDQQEEAVETIAEAWPTDLDSIAAEGTLPTMFYEQVLKDFLGPESEDLTFSQIESEYGSVEQWANSSTSDDDGQSDAAASDVEDMDPGAPETNSAEDEETEADAETGTDPATKEAAAEAVVDAAAADISVEGDVDEQRREWFAAGFREGVAFALENPELFEQR